MTLGVSFYSIIFFLSAFIYLYWGIYLIRIDPKEKVNQVFFALILAVFTWSVGYALSNSSMDIRTALFWRKMASVGRMSLFSIILHFMLLLTYSNFAVVKQPMNLENSTLFDK